VDWRDSLVNNIHFAVQKRSCEISILSEKKGSPGVRRYIFDPNPIGRDKINDRSKLIVKSAGDEVNNGGQGFVNRV
jgi:hypothetical protein